MKNMVLAIIVFCTVITPLNVMARTDAMRKQCSDCHTMHNSQDGATVAVGTGALLNASCYGCHSSSGGVFNGADKTPYVWQANPTYGTHTLAGGDYYWVSLGGNDEQGHNVEGVVLAQDPRTAPGGTEFFDAGRPLTCAGANGCHGDRSVTNEIVAMKRAHHSDDGAAPDGSTVAKSYRFLNGVPGYEVADWELTPSNLSHNQYKGEERGNDNAPIAMTISKLCANCHGDFHSGAGDAGTSNGTFGTDPWIRHPVDFGMPLSDEYASYGGLGVNDYVVETPLASVDVSASQDKVTATNERIIMCLSCHRAHGSPNDAILRWDYQNWPGGGYNGCGDCHTEKN